VIQFPLDTLNPGITCFDALISLEADIEQRSNGAYEVDGHDAGAAEMNIFIITENAITTFGLIRDLLPADVNWRAGFRDIDSDEYIPLAPAGLVSFQVK
jgi:hypothetical protein